jgi:hypothetical protein
MLKYYAPSDPFIRLVVILIYAPNDPFIRLLMIRSLGS